MRKLLLLLVLFTLLAGAASAEARARRHHHHHYHGHLASRSHVAADSKLGIERGSRPARPIYRSVADLAPADWQLQPPDPHWQGKRYLSPDGASWLAFYASPVGEEPIQAHLKAVAFAEGETITRLRGERNWIEVSGVKGDRTFFREAVLACAGTTWHHVAFEYPSTLGAHINDFVNRAADAVHMSENDGCDAATSRR